MRRGILLKILLIFTILSLQFTLIGAGSLWVELRNTNEKGRLVNLDSLIGGSGMPTASQAPKEAEDNDEAEEKKKDPSTASEGKEIAEARIKVSGTTVTINGQEVPESIVDKRIRFLNTEQVILTDDYADYQTFRKVLEYLKERDITPQMESSR